MGERKVLNKYYPPDFDPSMLPRGKGPKNDQFKVRMMVPMTVSCNTCAEYIYAGKKFNCRKEIVHGEDYLGIKIQRFYFKCPACSSEFTIKTDPKNADYQTEYGVSRLFESFGKYRDQEMEDQEKKEKDEAADAMLALESRIKDSKRENDTLDQLAAIRDYNARHERINADTLLSNFYDSESKSESKEEKVETKEEVKSTFVRRIKDDEEGPKSLFSAISQTVEPPNAGKKRSHESNTAAISRNGPILKIKPKKKVKSGKKKEVIKNDKSGPVSTGLGLLGGYGDDSD